MLTCSQRLSEGHFSARAAVDHLTNMFEVSQHRACVVIGHLRSTQRLARTIPPASERRFRARLREFARDKPRYGYRRFLALLLREGFAVNHKRLQRPCRDEGLRVGVSRRKRAHNGASTTPGDRF